MKLKTYLRFVGRKTEATFRLWTSWKSISIIAVTDEAVARASLTKILVRNFKPSSRQHMASIEHTAEEIMRTLDQFKSLSVKEQEQALIEGALTQAYWFHAQLSGLTATWEFKIRLFAGLLGISSNVPLDKKSRQNKSKRSVEHKKLSVITSEIHKLSGGRINLRLSELSGLRDSIVHCNPQSMKPYAESIIGREALRKFRGNVMMVDFVGSKPTNLSDLKEEHEVEDQPLYGWFIEVFNSGLPKHAYDIFSDSITAIDLLSHLKAISFGERINTFSNIFYHGKMPTKEEIHMFQIFFDNHPTFKGESAQNFFKRISSYFKLSN